MPIEICTRHVPLRFRPVAGSCLRNGRQSTSNILKKTRREAIFVPFRSCVDKFSINWPLRRNVYESQKQGMSGGCALPTDISIKPDWPFSSTNGCAQPCLCILLAGKERLFPMRPRTLSLVTWLTQPGGGD